MPHSKPSLPEYYRRINFFFAFLLQSNGYRQILAYAKPKKIKTMNRRLLLLAAVLFMSSMAFGQTRKIKITYDGTKGGDGCKMAGAAEAYLHSGAGVTDETSAWEFVVGNWGVDDGVGQMTADPGGAADQWEVVIDFDEYYTAGGMDAGATVYGIGFVVRNGDGSIEGKDPTCADIFIRGLNTDSPTVVDASEMPFDGATVTFLDPSSTNDLAGLGLGSFASYPNPFNDQTTIAYDITDEAKQVNLTILDIMGRTIKTIVNERQFPGQHHALWNGDNAKGQRVSAGTYFYRIEVDGRVAAKRVVIL